MCVAFIGVRVELKEKNCRNTSKPQRKKNWIADNAVSVAGSFLHSFCVLWWRRLLTCPKVGMRFSATYYFHKSSMFVPVLLFRLIDWNLKSAKIKKKIPSRRRECPKDFFFFFWIVFPKHLKADWQRIKIDHIPHWLMFCGTLVSEFRGVVLIMLFKLLSCVQLFAIPWTEVCWAPLTMEFPRQEPWSGLPFPPSQPIWFSHLPFDLSNPGIKPTSPALAGGFLNHVHLQILFPFF